MSFQFQFLATETETKTDLQSEQNKWNRIIISAPEPQRRKSPKISALSNYSPQHCHSRSVSPKRKVTPERSEQKATQTNNNESSPRKDSPSPKENLNASSDVLSSVARAFSLGFGECRRGEDLLLLVYLCFCSERSGVILGFGLSVIYEPSVSFGQSQNVNGNVVVDNLIRQRSSWISASVALEQTLLADSTCFAQTQAQSQWQDIEITSTTRPIAV
jgi:hypothetical protein